MALCVGFYMISVLCLCGLAFLLVMILRKGLESVFTIFLLIILPPMCLSEKILCFVPNMYSLMFPANILRGYENNWSFLSLKYWFCIGYTIVIFQGLRPGMARLRAIGANFPNQSRNLRGDSPEDPIAKSITAN